MKISRKKLTSIVTLTVFLSLPATASFASVTIEPVSYTPLDVYKRQMPAIPPPTTKARLVTGE